MTTSQADQPLVGHAEPLLGGGVDSRPGLLSGRCSFASRVRSPPPVEHSLNLLTVKRFEPVAEDLVRGQGA